MAGIDRQKALIFANDAEVRLVTAFRTTEDETPTKTKQPNVIQNANYLQGWINNDNTGNVEPYAEDMNAVFYTLSYNTAYLYEKGIPEYSADQTYQQNSFCQYGGVIYRCKTDSTINVLPTNTTYWDKMETAAYSASNIGTTGAGVYASMTGNNFNFKKIKSSDSSVTITEGPDYIDLKSYTGGGTASFTANSPLTYSSGVLSISKADGSTNGYLSSADWTSFNSKLSSTIFSANNSWTGTNTFSAITLGVNDLATTLSGKQDTISVSTPLDLTSNTLSISQANGSTNGYLSSTDWTTFNGKQNAIDANNKLSSAYLTFDSDIIPTTNNTYDIGSSSLRWKKAYLSGISMSQNGVAFEVESQNSLKIEWRDDPNASTRMIYCENSDFRPFGNNLLNLGNASNLWKNVYTYNIQYAWNNTYIQSTSTGGLDISWQGNNGAESIRLAGGAIYPVNGTIDLGSLSTKWNNIYSNNFILTTNCKIQNTASGDALELYWNNTDLTPNASAALQLVGSCVRAFSGSSGTIDLGNQYIKWRNGWFTGSVSCNELAIDEAHIAHVPTLDNPQNTMQLLWNNNNGPVAIYMKGDYFYPYQSNQLNLGSTNNRWFNIYSNNSVNVSDRRTKSNIEDLENGLEKLNTIDVKSYSLNGHNEGIMYGFIAQDELERNPELVVVPDDYSEEEGGGELCYMPNNVLFLAVKAIQELSEKVSVLENKLGELK